MPSTHPLFDDITPVYEPGEDPIATRVTLVEMPDSIKVREKFMGCLQSALNGQFAQAALTPMQGYERHAIGCASERYLRAKLQLQGETNDAKWCKRLVKWGAISADVFPSDVFKRLLDHRLDKTATTVDPKVFLPPDAEASKPARISITVGAVVPTGATLAVPANAKIDWHLDIRGANVVAAWQKFLDRNPPSTDLPWKHIVVGHLDTGYIAHEALAWDSSVTPPVSTTILHTKGQDYFEIPKDNDPKDPWISSGFPGHGTRIAGAISGFDPRDQAHPYYGSAPGVQIIPYRVTDSVIADHVPHHIADAINQALSDNCHIITVCLGALRGSSRVARAVDQAYEKGMIVVCAAGQVWPWVIYPGRFNRVMTVSGIGPGGSPWGSAACGKYVDWCAPADQIRRLKIRPRQDGSYETGVNPTADGDGTSYATAITSGIAAMWLAWHGVQNLRAKYAGQEWMISAVFKKLAKDSCNRWPTGSAGNTGYGAGIINASRLLEQPLPDAGSLNKEAAADAGFDSSH